MLAWSSFCLKELVGLSGFVLAGSVTAVLAAQKKHRLLTEQVPEPPRQSEPQRPPPGIEHHGFFHLDARHHAKLTEIRDAAKVDVGSLPPSIGQVVGAGHVPAKRHLEADLP